MRVYDVMLAAVAHGLEGRNDPFFFFFETTKTVVELCVSFGFWDYEISEMRSSGERKEREKGNGGRPSFDLF